MTIIEFKKEKELQVCDSDSEKEVIEDNPFMAEIDKQGNVDFYAFVDTKIDGSEVRFYCYLDLNKLKQFEQAVKQTIL